MGTTDIEKRALKGGVTLPDLSDLPTRQTRKQAAAFLTKHYFSTSPRTLERAPLRWTVLNGQAHVLTSDLIDYGEAVIANAPVLMGGHGRRSAEQRAA